MNVRTDRYTDRHTDGISGVSTVGPSGACAPPTHLTFLFCRCCTRLCTEYLHILGPTNLSSLDTPLDGIHRHHIYVGLTPINTLVRGMKMLRSGTLCTCRYAYTNTHTHTCAQTYTHIHTHTSYTHTSHTRTHTQRKSPKVALHVKLHSVQIHALWISDDYKYTGVY